MAKFINFIKAISSLGTSAECSHVCGAHLCEGPGPDILTPTQCRDRNGRTYLTPEDVTASLRTGCPREEVQVHVLQHLARKNAEDWSLCALVALAKDHR